MFYNVDVLNQVCESLLKSEPLKRLFPMKKRVDELRIMLQIMGHDGVDDFQEQCNHVSINLGGISGESIFIQWLIRQY